jgi:Bacterial Ig-like domain (group 1)
MTHRPLRAVVTLLAAMVTMAIGAASAQAAITTVTNDAAGALQIANAMKSPSANVTGAGFDSAMGAANGTADSPFGNYFPTNGTTWGILTTGDVQQADEDQDNFSSVDTGANDQVRGVSDEDVTIFKVNLTVPQGNNCLRFDFQFLSEEYPDFIGSNVSDSFVAEMDVSNWTTTSGSAPPTAPNNFAFDQNGNPISINTSGPLAMSEAEAAGTTYGGATPLLSASTEVTPGNHVLYLSILDQGDSIYDSAVFLDNLVVGFVPNPQEQCQEGAQQLDYAVTLSPATATNPVGTQHTVTANVTEPDDPAPGKTVFFQVSGANSTSGTAVTNSSGDATFTYTGANAGDDTIVACVDEDDDGNYCEAGEATASASKTWEAANGPAGWMSGEGRLTQGAQTLDYAYIMDCDADKAPRFTGRRNGQKLSVSDVTSMTCSDDPGQEPAVPGAAFDTMVGSGTGKLGSTNVVVEFEFVDGGLDNTDDYARVVVERASNGEVLFEAEAEPIPPYGGGTRLGRNTANPASTPCPC